MELLQILLLLTSRDFQTDFRFSLFCTARQLRMVHGDACCGSGEARTSSTAPSEASRYLVGVVPAVAIDQSLGASYHLHRLEQ